MILGNVSAGLTDFISGLKSQSGKKLLQHALIADVSKMVYFLRNLAL